ncbi:YfiT family bacillithiol transferase [Fodinibius halophilus]|uniref:Putative metal-dependent hydrolase n=1 Tax=Fodinibius halophilus TaxID=1736908 RepID=A0A6M1T3D1_9BACT|nr:putative metal-dependent hydrolase [Fodinibius halophilus]NGP87133.1 putative metal-dependent hydrolase [Fodinibius halophilus]
MQSLKYPIGQYQTQDPISPRDIARWIDEIEALPEQLRNEVSELTTEQLDTPYRENGWTLRQVIHHIADSHLNGYLRVKLTLTEDKPTIKSYDQDSWANLSDTMQPVASSLKMITGIHQRWTHVLKSLDKNQLNRELVHPDKGILVLKSLIGLYAWHGKHHLAHITTLKKRKNWTQ